MATSPLSGHGLTVDGSLAGPPKQRQHAGPSGVGSALMEVLRTTGLLDDATREFWDGLTSLSAGLLSVPVAMLALVEGDHTLTMSIGGGQARVGDRWTTELEPGVREHMGDSSEPVVVADGHWNDPHRSTVSRVVRAWITWPLVTADGSIVGALTVLDVRARFWADADLALLGVLARSASAQLSLLGAADAERTARDDLQAVRDSEARVEQRLQRLASVALELLRADKI